MCVYDSLYILVLHTMYSIIIMKLSKMMVIILDDRFIFIS